MKRGKQIRNSKGNPVDPNRVTEIPALMFMMVERAPGAFSLRFVSNDDLLKDLENQGALQSFLDDVDRLYADFLSRYEHLRASERPN